MTDAYMAYDSPSAVPPQQKPTPKPPRRRSGGIAALFATALFLGAIFGAAVSTLVDDPAPVIITEQPVAEPATPAEQRAPAPAPSGWISGRM